MVWLRACLSGLRKPTSSLLALNKVNGAMASTVEVRTDLTELARRLRTAAQALMHPPSDHTLSSEERAALCEEVKAIAAELRRDWHIEAFGDWRARK